MLGFFLHLWQIYGRGSVPPIGHAMQHIVCHVHNHHKVCTIKL